MTSVPRTEAISPSDRPLHGDSGSPTSIRVKSSSTPEDRSATPLGALAEAGPGSPESATAARRVAASLPTTSLPPRQPGEQGRGPHPHEIGQGEGDDVRPLLRRQVRGAKLLLEYLLRGQSSREGSS